MGIIIFLGDSITDAERKRSPNQLGYGYVNILAESIKNSERNWNIVNRGVDGYITERVARSPSRLYFSPPRLCKYFSRD